MDNNQQLRLQQHAQLGGYDPAGPLPGGEYETGTFYPLFYQPDGKVSVLDLDGALPQPAGGHSLDVTQPGQEGNRVIGTQKSSQIHLIQTFPEWPASCSAITWLCLGNAEHSVFIPSFSGITDTAAAYQVDGDTYDGDGAFWKCKRICTLAEQDRATYSQGVRDFWSQQEGLMYREMVDAAPIMLEQAATAARTARSMSPSWARTWPSAPSSMRTTCTPSCSPV
ncbi:MAG: C69 family dipeptidase [Oscillospiraceae bacterium]